MLVGDSNASEFFEDDDDTNEVHEIGEEELSDASEPANGKGPENEPEDEPLTLEAQVLNLCHALGGFEREPAAEGVDEKSRKWTYVLGDEILGEPRLASRDRCPETKTRFPLQTVFGT